MLVSGLVLGKGKIKKCIFLCGGYKNRALSEKDNDFIGKGIEIGLDSVENSESSFG